jgi:polyphosphate kinase 2 (PPK2 family)
MFEAVDLQRKLAKSDYKRLAPDLQHRLWELQRSCWEAGIPSLWVFEGWDASGKGPCIRKITERLEPRGFELHHVTDEPRTHELDLPWMWRFWLDLPRRGKIAIFDRSWNRRLLVQRVEKGRDELGWRRGLRDIGDFERMLSDDGYVIVKFFLHISKEDQLRRYEKWKKDPADSWKALEGGWQKPTRYEDHLSAAEDLLQNTELLHSPWTIVPATDHRSVLVQVLETLIDRLQTALADSGVPVPDLRRSGADVGLEQKDPVEGEGS